MRTAFIKSVLALLIAGQSTFADVVYTNAVNESSSFNISSTAPLAQTFTNTGLTSKIQSVTVYLQNSSGASGNLFIRIRGITGTPGGTPGAVLGSTFTPAMDSATVSVGGNYSNVSAVTFNFTNASRADLLTNTTYAFVVNTSGLTGSISLFYGSQIANQNSIFASSNTADSTNDLAGQVVTAIPEPSTLALGGIAAAFGGLFFRQKKSRAGVSQPATV
jgi:hypothetical protein